MVVTFITCPRAMISCMSINFPRGARIPGGPLCFPQYQPPSLLLSFPTYPVPEIRWVFCRPIRVRWKGGLTWTHPPQWGTWMGTGGWRYLWGRSAEGFTSLTLALGRLN